MTTTFHDLVRLTMEEAERRGRVDVVMASPSAPGECAATALFAIQNEFSQEQFKLVFALGQHALVSHVFGVQVPGPYAQE